MTCMSIAERFVPEDELRRVAEAVLLSQDIRGSSWSKAEKRYITPISEALKQAVAGVFLDDFWAGPVTWWNIAQWNEVQEWANEILEHEKDE